MKTKASILFLLLLPCFITSGLYADDSNGRLACYDYPIAKEFLLHPNLVYSKQLFPESSLWLGEVSDFSLTDEQGKPVELVIVARQFALTRNYTKDELEDMKKNEGIDVIEGDMGFFAIYLSMQINNTQEREKFILSITDELSVEKSYLAAFGTPKSVYRFKDQNYPLINYDNLIFGPEFLINSSSHKIVKFRADVPFGGAFFNSESPELIEDCHELSRCDNRWDRSTALRCAADKHLKKSLSQFKLINDFGQETTFNGFRGDDLEKALLYIDQLISLVPENPGAHYMKTEVLFSAGLFRDGVNSIQQALNLYNQKWAEDSWISFSGKLSDSGMIHELIRLSQILSNYYPDDSRYLANIAGAYGMLGDFDNGLAYARKVYEISPDDYINTWNLGYFLENTGSQEDPEVYYLEAISATVGHYEHNRYQCLYADFLERQDDNSTRACELRSKHCTEIFDSKCLN